MEYVIRIPAINGDVIPLIFVAVEMATAASTAYGRTQPHKPIYDGHLPIHTKSLLHEARAGRLRVCNQLGYQGTVEELIAAAKSSGHLSEVSRYLVEPDWERLHQESPPVVEGVWDFTGIDLGPSEIDWDATYLGCLHAKLHHLNEWGKTNGDEFTISSDSVEWIDERGVMRPTEATGKTAKPVMTDGASGGVKPPSNVPAWRLITSLARAPGYRWALYQFLKAAHIAGKPCPKARDFLEWLKSNPDPELQVMPDGLKYNDGARNPKEADLKAIQQAIKGLLQK